jgi:Cu(I)/Ag(I) efflux system membrane fusion protein
MKKLINTIRDNYKWTIIVLIAGVFLGWLFFHSSRDSQGTGQVIQTLHEGHDHEEETPTVWTCSMHPQIRKDEPGKCPICAMDLVPLAEVASGGDDLDPDEISMTESAARLADIQTVKVRRGTPVKEVFLQGKVQADERRIAELTARIGGRIEYLYINFTGKNVRKGQKLARVYSPELVTAQRELLETMSYKDSRPSLYNAARGKLKLWDLTDDQIDAIEMKGEPQLYFEILSPISGTVMKRHVALGDYVKEGSPMFEVIDMTYVWIMLDAYESDLPWIKIGDPVTYRVKSLPEEFFQGEVVHIDPFIDPATRVVRVRIHQKNPGLELKPEMFVSGIIESTIAEASEKLLIPKSSILWTGKRSVVYVKVPGRDQPTFLYREIELGPESGNFYLVNSGLEEGEEIAINGVFRIDAAAQLAGKPSMMNPEGRIFSGGHDHGAMENGGVTTDHSKHADMDMENETMEVPQIFQDQLTGLYMVYLEMKNGFVASDYEAVAKHAAGVQKALVNVNMQLLKGDAHIQWMDQQSELNNSLQKIVNSEDIEIQRAGFREFNQAWYKSIKSFGLKDVTVYYQYCPMAFDDQGAYWFSNEKEIANPYFGDMMLRCGETRKTFDF